MLEVQQYLNKIENLRKACTGYGLGHANLKNDTELRESNSRQFASANLRQLLPTIPVDEHDRIINDIAFHQACAVLDEDSFFLLGSTQINDPDSVLESAKNKPVIFCTFHLGSYRLINSLLVSRGFNYILPVESFHYKEQKAGYLENSSKCQAHFHSTSQFVVVDAEQPTAALTMARKARAGWSLLAYIDGNTGVKGSAQHNDKLLRIPLLGRPIYARKGIAFLSHFLKLPIIPVTCEITGALERRMTFHAAIESGGPDEGRDSYCLRATTSLYAVLGEYLKRNPSQWLGWLTMLQYLDADDISNNNSSDEHDVRAVFISENNKRYKLMFNHQRFGFVVNDGQRVLLDKVAYKLLSIPNNIAEILDTYSQPIETLLSESSAKHRYVIEQLVSLEMLSIVS
jgi:lauroyl/myristoyl acyltransferase